MPLLSRRCTLAITAVIDIAMNSNGRPVSAKALARQHKLPPRHLEPVLQALVHDGILRGIRGPHGGYELARQGCAITAEDILRAAGKATEDEVDDSAATSTLLTSVVRPALSEAEQAFSAALRQITVEGMMQQANSMK
ncbi:MAG TPA: Rrf2 family transcriptional regulator [Pseudolabrys sp.]|jgi:Rrf2 family protein|nr:Rrf2 family transcriptional regulator [Pseudolabrys sp.]